MVIDSRKNDAKVTRRRRCKTCGFRTNTVEKFMYDEQDSIEEQLQRAYVAATRLGELLDGIRGN